MRKIINLLISSKIGKSGLMMLIILLVMSSYVFATYPSDFGAKYNSPLYWSDNPKLVPPEWVNFFREKKLPRTFVFESTKPTIPTVFVFKLDYNFEESPSFISVTFKNATYHSHPIIFAVSISRPDGKEVIIYKHILSAPRPDENPPIRRYSETPFRVELSSDEQVISNAREFAKNNYGVDVGERFDVNKILFGVWDEDFKTLKGNYEIRVRAITFDERDSIEMVKFVVGGKVYGLVGTDDIGRDLASALLFGIPTSLFVGIIASTLVVALGVFVGMISYVGGWVDNLIQRILDIINNIPTLPILILLTFLIKPSIYILILLLVIFSWPGIAINIRPMVLQIKTQQFVHAAIIMGASKWRIMFVHILPQLSFYVIYILIFSVPGAILSEAALSFLGLGDPTTPTLGQVLERGFRSSAILLGYWWWMLPPGILIQIISLTFVLIALALEPLMNPKLMERKPKAKEERSILKRNIAITRLPTQKEISRKLHLAFSFPNFLMLWIWAIQSAWGDEECLK